jgi:hypothetical protein
MANKQIGVIRISKRTIQMGHQVYSLANISRVQSLELVWGGKNATFYPLREIAVWLVLVGLIIFAALKVVPNIDAGVDFDIEATARKGAAAIAVLVGIRVVYLLVLMLYRLLIRQRRYTLVLETAGTQYTALSGTDHREISRIKGEIVQAIEDPPQQDRIVHLSGDIVLGDKVGGDKVSRDKIMHG